MFGEQDKSGVGVVTDLDRAPGWVSVLWPDGQTFGYGVRDDIHLVAAGPALGVADVSTQGATPGTADG